MRRRLDLAASVIRAPQVLFLDEPTTGLDPRSRNQVWDTVRSLVMDGTTVLLTTQYLEEADQLADRISVIDGGLVIAEGTPDELKSVTGGDRIEIVVRRAGEVAEAAQIVERIATAQPDVDPETRRLSAPVSERITVLTEVLRTLQDADIAVEDVSLRRPTLDEAFLELTGHRTDENTEAVA